jgi:hypothetical protein
MKSRIVSIQFLIFLFVFTGYSQTDDLNEILPDTSVSLESAKGERLDKFQFNVSTGMSFSSFTRGVNSTGTYIYPSASMRVNDKLQLDIGTYFLKNNFSGTSGLNFNNTGIAIKQAGYQSTSGFVNARAQYDVTDKINISGFMMKSFGNDNRLIQNYYNNMSLMGIGVDYEILPNLSIGAQFNYYNAPSIYSPYTPGFTNPVSPMNDPFSW